MKFFSKYILPVLFGLIIYTTIRLMNDTVSGTLFWKRVWYTNAIEITTVIFTSYLTFYLLGRLLNWFNRKNGPTPVPKSIFSEFGIVLLVCLVLNNALITPMVALTDNGLQWSDLVMINILPTLYILLVFTIYRSRYYLKAYVDNKLLLEKITTDKLETELKFLKAQYHPHFLFNALNTIYFQMDENTEAAKKTVEQFSALLRYQLYDQQQTVPVSREFEYMDHFIQLQRIRASDKLNLEVRIDPALTNQEIYPLLLLPLVENAFKYVGGDYHLQICAKEKEGHLQFTVKNSTPPTLPPRKESGIGLENLRRRLALLYPNQHELKTTKQGDEFHASLLIKLKPHEN